MPTTPECIVDIEAQGLMGQLTTANTGSVAVAARDAVLRGRPVYIPGAINRFLCSAGRLVPAKLGREVGFGEMGRRASPADWDAGDGTQGTTAARWEPGRKQGVRRPLRDSVTRVAEHVLPVSG